MKIRRAERSDIETCVRIHHETELYEDINITRSDMITLIKSANCRFLVSEEKGKVVGYIIFRHEKWNNSVYIDQLFIESKFQGKGIGSRLLNEAVKFAKKHDIRIIFLDTGNDRPNAIRFYLKNGFEIAGYNKDLYKGGKKDAIMFSYKLKE